MRDDVQQLAEELTQRENALAEATNPQIGPRSKELAETRDALAARIQHPARRT